MKNKHLLVVPVAVLLLLGAGCNPFSHQEEQTPPVVQPPSTTPPDTTVPSTSQKGTKTFSDEVNRYEITAPDEFTFEPQKIGTQVTGLENLEGGVSFLYPQSFFVRSISEAKIILKVEETKKCVPSKQTVMVKTLTFNHTTVADAGAGNQYRTEDYSTEKDGKCYHVALFTHTTTPENYAQNDQEAKTFRTEHDAAVKKINDAFQSILNTFVFLP